MSRITSETFKNFLRSTNLEVRKVIILDKGKGHDNDKDYCISESVRIIDCDFRNSNKGAKIPIKHLSLENSNFLDTIRFVDLSTI